MFSALQDVISVEQKEQRDQTALGVGDGTSTICCTSYLKGCDGCTSEVPDSVPLTTSLPPVDP